MVQDHFPERIAARYDASLGAMADPALVGATVDVLADLAGDGPALELGIGTGRIALPLRERGVEVHGIDLSEAMVAQLRAKHGGAAIPVTMGDFASVRAPGTFALVYLLFNTIMNLTTQDQQVACFRNAARHLAPGGCFVIEVSVPRLQRLPPGETFQPFTVTPTRLGIDEYDVATQRLVSHHYVVSDGVLDSNAIPFRYVWPAELDLMAQLAGMSLSQRWGGWGGEPFTSSSSQHVSVWRSPDQPVR